MKLFADTADLRELKELDEMGLICGITTNPTIASQTGKNLVECSSQYRKGVPGDSGVRPGGGQGYGGDGCRG